MLVSGRPFFCKLFQAEHLILIFHHHPQGVRALSCPPYKHDKKTGDVRNHHFMHLKGDGSKARQEKGKRSSFSAVTCFGVNSWSNIIPVNLTFITPVVTGRIRNRSTYPTVKGHPCWDWVSPFLAPSSTTKIASAAMEAAISTAISEAFSWRYSHRRRVP